MPTPSPRPRVVSLSTVYPSPRRPSHGLFVEERLVHAAAHADLEVVAPIPWHQCLPGEAKSEVRRGLRVHHPRFWYLPGLGKGWDGRALFRSAWPRLRSLAASQAVDLVDAHFAWPEGEAALHLSRRLRIPFVVTLRGTLEWLGDDPRRGPRMAEVVRRADALIAVSHKLAERALALGAEPSRVHVIPNGVDLARFQPRDKAAARVALGLPPEGRLIVSVGHMSPRKGFQDLIACLPRLRRQFPSLRLALVGGSGGEGDNRRQLEALARSLGVQSVTHFLGTLDRERVAQALSAGDLFALASRYEGCPNVVLEALACGRPVVASSVGEIPHLVPPEAGCVYGEATDRAALFAALAEGLERQFDPANLRACVAGRTWEGCAQRVAQVWQEVLQAAH